MTVTAPLHCIVLAAGQGTRMKSALPKVLHPVGGKAMLGHVLDTARALGAAGVHIVYGHGGDQVQSWFARTYPGVNGAHWAQQRQQLGTAHAVLQAMPQVPDGAQVLILYGDVPLTSPATLQAVVEAGRKTLAVVTVELDQPKGYGRILRKAGAVAGIVEENDASPRQKLIREVNTGIFSAPAKRLRGWLGKVRNDNAKGEYYLTDVVALAVKDRLKVATVPAASAVEVEGVNDRLQLARMERVFQLQQAEALLRDGLYLADPARFDLRGRLRHGRDVRIDVGCVLEGEVELADGVQIGPYCVLRNVRLGPGAVIEPHSILEDSTGGANVHVGPFARLRPGTELADEAKVGNFVETKKARVGRGSKINHLSYVGDAVLGADVNVGAGTITCNYDGANKHETRIDDGVFVGSNSSLVAPVRIGEGATIGAASVIAKDVPAGGLTLCRAREQKSFPGWKRPQKKAK
ncbi:MAG TPA: bifunctional UDP-N-acetylglucosamine diphosphorylase/glucosamine-1-phosphate N-acetyltransferase GlmU [Solimonas sp.]|nr:bifunctional UDP-N-acetylglucosamine diphosphorylase/glucosamine-1-phosphate N-acetyltransferase GlmU [Solimonas sp.]